MGQVHPSKPKGHGKGQFVHNATVLPESLPRRIQNFVLIWLDSKLDENKSDFKKSLQQLHRIVASLNTFTDVRKCFEFLSEVKTEKVFMIVSGTLGQRVVPEIEALPQLGAIYVFCKNKEFHERWAKTIPKVRGVYTEVELICEALQIDSENCDRAAISVSFNGIDPLFMYTQLLKEAILEIEDDDNKSINEFVEFCRLQNDLDKKQIELIEWEYHQHTPIWWYTSDSFMYSMLNRGLRLMDIDIILKMGFFIRHLHIHIQQLYNEQQSNITNIMSSFKVYRGQGLSLENFNKLKKTTGNLMSFNNFLSTSRNRIISLNNFARPAAFQVDSVGILFAMTIDPKICLESSIPFVDVTHVGYFKGGESEILFTTHTIFRIDKIQRIQDDHTDRLWKVNLTLVGNEDHELNSLVSNLREDSNRKGKGWSRLGYILIKLGEPVRAEYLYKALLKNKSANDVDRAQYYHQLGYIYDDLGECEKALSSYQRALEIRKIVLPPNHPDLAASYNNIGLVYADMDEYSKALASYERAFEIFKIALPPDHPELAALYNNIGLVYYNMREYSKALSSYECSLEIKKRALSPNHPTLANTYNNIGNVYNDMGEYSKALSSYERSLEIDKIALPPNHPDLASDYNNIGSVYDKMGEYSKALLHYEKAQKIWTTSLPSTHPHIELVKTNIDNVIKKIV